MDNRDRNRILVCERLLMPDSGACESERATARKELNRLRAAPPPTPRPMNFDDLFGRAENAGQYTGGSDEASVPYQREHVSAVAGWKSSSILRHLHDCRETWTTGEWQEFRRMERESGRKTIVENIPDVLRKLADSWRDTSYYKAHAYLILRDLPMMMHGCRTWLDGGMGD